MPQKRPFNEGKRHFKKNKKQKNATGIEGSNEDVLTADVRRMLQEVKTPVDHDVFSQAPEHLAQVELEITELSSTGDGLARKNAQVYVVPFVAPGDHVVAKVYKTSEDASYHLTDLVRVISPSPHRTETPPCPHFARCAGCQFQHLSYDYQLAHKRRVVEQAYRTFSGLPAASVPPVRETAASPLLYGYRTKLTPHFDGPPGGRRDKKRGQKVTWPEVPPIGFMLKGTRRTLDIEDCPIGTEAVRRGMKSERKRVKDNIDDFQRGATLLCRESTRRIEKSADAEEDPEEGVVVEDVGQHVHRKTCITDQNAISTEYVDDYRFDNPAGAFFQNNNSVLPLITQYIRDNILGQAASTEGDGEAEQPPIKNMVDAYCGSGFFTIMLSSMFSHSIGIDISPQSIASASRNAQLNHLPEGTTRFIAADANDLFASIDTDRFRPRETAVVIDPPRKGCDVSFIRQLLRYGPARVCYVSCNVHTQARDVGWLVQGIADGEAEGSPGRYEIESIRGFDFFPQTSHVEGVAILRRRGGDVAHGDE